ncbi:hypothetical protein HYFRA_00009919 [Hymenoscyphus fraxineus]|uniref:Heterokaryon incompatibility domain-containing protein n=1 Tax=Hymenoscyphus fraxineus TaxID=746836 RepID=A0A9N9L7V8_9HELO|nr:hypothetical protein HYFRA_00009919 [Hymenoscyphus fraxineus]
MEPCEVCLGLSVGNELENDRWELVVRVDNTIEHSLEFESTQMSAAAESGCVTCSVILNGISLMSRNSSLFDTSQGYRGRLVVQRRSPLEVEILDKNQRGYARRATARGRMQIYALPENKSTPPAFWTSRHIPREPTIEYCSSIISDWITNCRANHGACTQVPSSETNTRVNELPKRLLDLKHSPSYKDSVKLVQTGCYTDQQPFRYATLSHCWGKSHVIQTTTNNMELRMQSIGWNDLPKTFQDAITLLRALDIRYLWIDSLCIIQDDPLDWAAESMRMAAIYSNSFVNIAATGSFDSRGGCFHPRILKHTVPTSEITSFPIKIPENSLTQTLYVRHSLERVHQSYSAYKSPEYDPPDSQIAPLLSRAWVFQERFLAPRTIHFHPSELIMECKTSLRCECSGLNNVTTQNIRRSLIFAEREQVAIQTAWLDIVEEYSILRLTRESDRLPALHGVATVFQDKLGCGYLSGIWQDDIARGVLWKVTDTRLRGGRRAERNRSVPSWSWASQILDAENSRLFFITKHDDTFQADERFRLIDTNIPLGPLESNLVSPPTKSISLHGAFVTATIHPYNLESRNLHDLLLIFEQDIDDTVLITTAEMNIDSSTGCTFAAGSTAYCLLVGHSRRMDLESRREFEYQNIIVLQQTSENRKVFERVGIIAIEKDLGIFDEASESEFVVI